MTEDGNAMGFDNMFGRSTFDDLRGNGFFKPMQTYTYLMKPVDLPDFVRCKECRRHDADTSTCVLSGLSVGPNDFCSKGERKNVGK